MHRKEDGNAGALRRVGGVAMSAAEMAVAELAATITVLMPNGNVTMIPYRVLRSRFHPAKVPDAMLTVALSSCTVLVRGNFALRLNMAKFLALTGGGERKLKLMRELRDVILLPLNMHGMVQRERLARAFSSRGGGGVGFVERRMANNGSDYDPIIDPETITFVLGNRTIAGSPRLTTMRSSPPNFRRWRRSTQYIG